MYFYFFQGEKGIMEASDPKSGRTDLGCGCTDCISTAHAMCATGRVLHETCRPSSPGIKGAC